MATGCFYPELLTSQLYVENPQEMREFLNDLRAMFLAGPHDASGTYPNPEALSGSYDLYSKVAIGSLIHEYVHLLQYTSRFVGVGLYECRFQQFLGMKECIRDLGEHCAVLPLPLLAFAENAQESQGPIGRILDKWRKHWMSYQAALAASGMYGCLSTDARFERHVTDEFYDLQEVVTPVMRLGDQDCKVSTRWILELEAHTTTSAFLSMLFPQESSEVVQRMSESTEGEAAAAVAGEGLAQLRVRNEIT